MPDIPIYNAKEALLSEDEMSLTELPPIPEWFTQGLLEVGGTCDGKPNLRVVSGLDPNITEFYGGRWWLKYATREHVHHEYVIWHKPDGTKKILSPKESEILGKQKNLKGILLPVVDHQIIEYGIPRYFLEYYKPPEYFGSPDAWEKERFIQQEDGTLVDLMGEFPSEGWYETWFSIENPVLDENGEVVKTTFRQLDEIVLELIKFKVEENKTRLASIQHSKMREEADREYIKKKEEVKEQVREIIKDRIDDILD